MLQRRHQLLGVLLHRVDVDTRLDFFPGVGRFRFEARSITAREKRKKIERTASGQTTGKGGGGQIS